MWFIMKLATLLKIRIDAKNILCIRIQSQFNLIKSQWVKQYAELDTQKRIKSEKKEWQKNVVQINK